LAKYRFFHHWVNQTSPLLNFDILLDTFMLFPHLLNKDLSPAKTIFWYPSDGGAGMPKGCESILKKVDFYTKNLFITPSW